MTNLQVKAELIRFQRLITFKSLSDRDVEDFRLLKIQAQDSLMKDNLLKEQFGKIEKQIINGVGINSKIIASSDRIDMEENIIDRLQ